MDEVEEVVSEAAPWFVWFGLSAVACIAFWVQATVTEER